MNFLDMMDPQKRKALELMQMQQMQQQFVPPMLQQQMPQGMGALQQMPMPMQQGQAGYGVLAPEANTGMAQAAAGGAQSFAQGLPAMIQIAGLLGGAGGGSEAPPPLPPPPPGKPVGTSKDGLARAGNGFQTVKRRRKVRGLLGDE